MSKLQFRSVGRAMANPNDRAVFEQLIKVGNDADREWAKAELAKLTNSEITEMEGKLPKQEREPGIGERVVRNIASLPGAAADAAKTAVQPKTWTGLAHDPQGMLDAYTTGLGRMGGKTPEGRVEDAEADVARPHDAPADASDSPMFTGEANTDFAAQRELENAKRSAEGAKRHPYVDAIAPMTIPIEGMLGKALSKAIPAATGALARGDRVVKIAAGTGGGGAAIRSTIQGKTPGEIAADTLEGAGTGAFLGVPFAATESAGVGVNSVLSDKRHKMGRNNAALDASAEYRKTPEYKSKPKGEARTDQIAFEEGQKISDQAQSAAENGPKEHAEAIDKILSSKGRVDPKPLHAALDKLEADNISKITGEPQNADLQAEIDAIRKKLTAPDRHGRRPLAPGEEYSPGALPADDSLPIEGVFQVRDDIKGDAFKQSREASPKQEAQKIIYHALKEALESTDDRIGPLNIKAKVEMDTRKRASDLIAKNDETSTSTDASARSRMQSGMKKLGTSQGVGAAGADAAELASLDYMPGVESAYSDALMKIAAAHADANTSVGIPSKFSVSGLLGKNLSAAGRGATHVARGLSQAGAAPWLPGFLGNSIEDDYEAARMRLRERQRMTDNRRNRP